MCCEGKKVRSSRIPGSVSEGKKKLDHSINTSLQIKWAAENNGRRKKRTREQKRDDLCDGRKKVKEGQRFVKITFRRKPFEKDCNNSRVTKEADYGARSGTVPKSKWGKKRTSREGGKIVLCHF